MLEAIGVTKLFGQHRALDGISLCVEPGDMAAFGQQILNVPQAQCETEIEPGRLADHIGREAVSLEENGLHGRPRRSEKS